MSAGAHSEPKTPERSARTPSPPPTPRKSLFKEEVRHSGPFPRPQHSRHLALRRIAKGDLAGRADALASRLAETGLAPGQRVCVGLPSGADAVAALVGCWLRGLAVVPADLERVGAALVRRAKENGCRLVVTDAAASAGPARERVRDLPFGPLPVLVWDRASAPEERPIPPPALPADHPALVYPEPSGPCFTIGAAGLAVHGLSVLRHLADARGAGDSILLLLPLHHSSLGSLVAGAL